MSINRNISNIPGWRTKRRIIIIESDDWGSIRMPSISVFEKLTKEGLNLTDFDALRYNLNDRLASSHDLESLFDILYSVKDWNGRNAVFTAISVVSNPDFEKIKDSGFNKYYWEPFTETLKKYDGCENSFLLWQKGIQNKIFLPQMHGREHLNTIGWLDALKKGDHQTRLAFEEGFWGFVPDPNLLPNTDFQAAFLIKTISDLEEQQIVIKEGLNLFENLFGYKAEYFVPPNGVFNNSLNKTLVENGVKFRSTSKLQSEPIGNGREKKVLHWLGQRDDQGIRYITRNCFFEPNIPGNDWIDSCLNDIKVAFRWYKPAIISSHRVNYIGSLRPENRDNGLRQLSRLLAEILKKWPMVEFMTTDNLGNLMNDTLEDK